MISVKPGVANQSYGWLRSSPNPNFSDDLYFGYRTGKKIKIQNDSPKFSPIDAISDIYVASDFKTHQWF
mgnify:FL=1|jgi:hypothetical protein